MLLEYRGHHWDFSFPVARSSRARADASAGRALGSGLEDPMVFPSLDHVPFMLTSFPSVACRAVFR